MKNFLEKTLAGRSKREQIMLVCLMAALFFAAVYFILFQPLQRQQAAAERGADSAKMRYDRVVSQLAIYKQSAKQPLNAQTSIDVSARTPAYLRQVILAQADKQAFSLTGLKSEAGIGVSVSIDRVESQRLYQWLYQLQSESAVIAARVTIQKTTTDGAVAAQILLTWDQTK